MFDAYLGNSLKVDDGSIIIDVTAHTHCYGRPGAAWAYEEIARKAAARDDVWIATRQEISDFARKAIS
jgi:hypothetical protein